MEKGYSFSKKFLEGEVKSGFWNTASYGITILSSFLIIYFLSVYEYGVYQLIISIIALAESLTIGLIDDVVFSDMSRYFGEKKYNQAKKLFKDYALLRIGSACILTCLIIIFSKIISVHYGYDMSFYISLIALSLPIMTAVSVMNIFFRANVYFSSLGAPVFGEILKLFFILILWFWQGIGLLQVIIAYVIGQFLSFLFLGFHFVKVYRRFKKDSSSSQEEYVSVKKLLRGYGFWIFLRYALAKISANIRPFLIKFFAGTEALGIFSFARNLISMLLRFFPVGTFGDLMPREISDKNRAKFLFVRTLKYSLWISVIFAVLSVSVFPILVREFLPKYELSMTLFKIMIPIILSYGVYKVLRMTLIVLKEQKILAIRSVDNSFLSPLLLVFLLPIFGVNGAGLEWSITYFVTTALFFYSLLNKHKYLSFNIFELFKFDKIDLDFAKNLYSSFKLLVFKK